MLWWPPVIKLFHCYGITVIFATVTNHDLNIHCSECLVSLWGLDPQIESHRHTDSQFVIFLKIIHLPALTPEHHTRKHHNTRASLLTAAFFACVERWGSVLNSFEIPRLARYNVGLPSFKGDSFLPTECCFGSEWVSGTAEVNRLPLPPSLSDSTRERLLFSLRVFLNYL